MYFVSSDIHSFYDEWMEALSKHGFEKNNITHKLIICGDLFDRGNQSVECFKFVQQMARQGRLIYIRGNHEDLLEECISTIRRRQVIASYHKTNGTLKTIAHFVGCTEYDLLCYSFDWKTFNKAVDPLLSFINKHCVDFYEWNSMLFVHGGLPVIKDDLGISQKVDTDLLNADWAEARWINGIQQWAEAFTIEDKIVVCGHWHTSWAWAHIDGNYSEWGPNSKFDIFQLDGLIAIDGCTAYSGKVNCLVFKEEDDKMSIPNVGETVYVVTRYTDHSPKEIVECIVETNRYNPRTQRKSFSVSGRWSNNRYYNATFTAKSMGKTVFDTYEDAFELID